MAGTRVDIDSKGVHALLTGSEVATFLMKKGLQVESRAKRLCPVDTGRLRASITSALEQDGDTIKAVVGTDVEYASFVEFGTVRMSARPFLLPALASLKSGTIV